jgi:hypothetical protein
MLAAGVASPHLRMARLPLLFRPTKKAWERDVRAHSGRGDYEFQTEPLRLSGRETREAVHSLLASGKRTP